MSVVFTVRTMLAPTYTQTSNARMKRTARLNSAGRSIHSSSGAISAINSLRMAISYHAACGFAL